MTLWGSLDVLVVHLLIFPINYAWKKISPPWGTHCTPWLRLWHIHRLSFSRWWRLNGVNIVALLCIARCSDESNRRNVQLQYKRDCYLSVTRCASNSHRSIYTTEWWVSRCPASKTKSPPTLRRSVCRRYIVVGGRRQSTAANVHDTVLRSETTANCWKVAVQYMQFLSPSITAWIRPSVLCHSANNVISVHVTSVRNHCSLA